jgi:sulfate adenylyltransferase subunit 2
MSLINKGKQMDYLEKLESKSVYILREAYREFKNLCMLWSIGKDSTVLLWLARKAFSDMYRFHLFILTHTSRFPK